METLQADEDTEVARKWAAKVEAQKLRKRLHVTLWYIHMGLKRATTSSLWGLHMHHVATCSPGNVLLVEPYFSFQGGTARWRAL